jgi:hypothetical protein
MILTVFFVVNMTWTILKNSHILCLKMKAFKIDYWSSKIFTWICPSLETKRLRTPDRIHYRATNYLHFIDITSVTHWAEVTNKANSMTLVTLDNTTRKLALLKKSITLRRGVFICINPICLPLSIIGGYRGYGLCGPTQQPVCPDIWTQQRLAH